MLVGFPVVISVCKSRDLMLKATLKAASGGELTGFQDLQSLISMLCSTLGWCMGTQWWRLAAVKCKSLMLLCVLKYIMDLNALKHNGSDCFFSFFRVTQFLCLFLNKLLSFLLSFSVGFTEAAVH